MASNNEQHLGEEASLQLAKQLQDEYDAETKSIQRETERLQQEENSRREMMEASVRLTQQLQREGVQRQGERLQHDQMEFARQLHVGEILPEDHVDEILPGEEDEDSSGEEDEDSSGEEDEDSSGEEDEDSSGEEDEDSSGEEDNVLAEDEDGDVFVADVVPVVPGVDGDS